MIPPVDETLARRLYAETAIDMRTIRRYLRGERVTKATRWALDTATARQSRARSRA